MQRGIIVLRERGSVPVDIGGIMDSLIVSLVSVIPMKSLTHTMGEVASITRVLPVILGRGLNLGLYSRDLCLVSLVCVLRQVTLL